MPRAWRCPCCISAVCWRLINWARDWWDGGRACIARRCGFLHPHVGQWAFVGDLEIPLAFSFTLAATFFISAWRADCRLAARRAALLAGVLLGIALFTKPTAGAFIWGALLCLAVEIMRTRLDASRWRSRCLVAIYAGLACLPMGGIWYARNWLLGHELITFPKSVWLTRALRSGDYLAPLAASVVVVFLTVALLHKLPRRRLAFGLAGLALLLGGLLASNPTLFPERVDPPVSYILPQEALIIAAGLALTAGSLYGHIGDSQNETTRRAASAAGWCLLLAAPYFVTYFFSYSYHFRLGFAVLPLLCLPTAAALCILFQPERMRRVWRRFCLIALVLLCLPGVISVAFDVRWSSAWLLRADLTGDWQKLQVFNPSLMEVVAGLNDFLREDEREPIVVAPGEERLPFFFPQMQIIDQPVTRLDELEALGATHFIFGAKARAAYRDAGLVARETQLVAALGRSHIIELKRAHYDGFLSYELYEVAQTQAPSRTAHSAGSGDGSHTIWRPAAAGLAQCASPANILLDAHHSRTKLARPAAAGARPAVCAAALQCGARVGGGKYGAFKPTPIVTASMPRAGGIKMRS